jgi:hypothetical protein
LGQIISNVQENTKNTYDVYGQVTQVGKNVTGNTPIVKYIYNDKGLRAAKLSYDGGGTLQAQLNYMYDAAGSLGLKLKSCAFFLRKKLCALQFDINKKTKAKEKMLAKMFFIQKVN